MNDNTIKIIIEGDASGLTSKLRTALDTVQGTVSKMNDQSVNWDSILAKTISPTIIGAVAATFANAIAQYTNFQNAATNLNNIGGAATDAFASSVGQAGGAAYTLAKQAGQSLGDTAASYNAFLKAGLDSAAATQAVSDASGIAYTTGQSLADVTSQLTVLFNNWGITTAPQVTDAMTGLANAAKDGEFSFNELVAAISPQGQYLQAKTNISDIALNLASLSTQSGLSKDSILNTFQAVSSATGLTAITMNTAFSGAATAISTGPFGLITAFEDIKKSVDKEGPLVAQSFGSQVGIMTSTISGFEKTTKQAFDNSAVALATAYQNLTPFDQLIENNLTSSEKLSKSWANFKTDIAEFILPPAITALQNALDDISSIVSGGISWKNFFSSIPSGVLSVSNGISGANQALAGGGISALAGLGKALENAFTGLLQSLGVNPGPFQNSQNPAPTPAGGKTVSVNITQNINGGSTGSPLLQQSSAQDAAYKAFQGIPQ